MSVERGGAALTDMEAKTMLLAVRVFTGARAGHVDNTILG